MKLMSLECTNCGYEAQSKTCSSCEKQVPTWVKFCPLCGVATKNEPNSETTGDYLSMEKRRLCHDGNCIGILDADSTCVVCGKHG